METALAWIHFHQISHGVIGGRRLPLVMLFGNPPHMVKVLFFGAGAIQGPPGFALHRGRAA